MIIPILFNTEMVQAIQAGRKTQTRRIIKPQPVWDGISCFHISKYGCWAEGRNDRIFSAEDNWPINTGDILWVRETWGKLTECNVYPPYEPEEERFIYRADIGDPDHFQAKWHPSIHMPKEAARIFLRVKDVRIDRLKAISASDAKDEGVTDWNEFVTLWDSTIKPADRDKYGWNADPWVWVIEFERCEKPEGWCV